MVTGEEIQEKILSFLKDHPQGAHAIQISNGIGHNRITIGKYLDILHVEKHVQMRTVGQAKLWSLTVSSKPKVLIVDDEEAVVNLIKLSLDDAGYELHGAHDGDHALQKVLEVMPDIIVLDIMMPKKSGLEVCQILKNNVLTQNIFIILLSAKSQTADKVAGIHSGADYYLTKPFDPQELAELIHTKLKLLKSLEQKHPITGLDRGEQVVTQINKQAQTDLLEVAIDGFQALGQGCGLNNSMHVLKLIVKLMQNQIAKTDPLQGYIGHIDENHFVITSSSKIQELKEHIEHEFDNALPFLLAGKPVERCAKQLSMEIKVTNKHDMLQHLG